MALSRVSIEHPSSHLNVDVQADQDWKGRPDIPWPSARSFICMPLIRPLDDLGDKAERVLWPVESRNVTSVYVQ